MSTYFWQNILWSDESSFNYHCAKKKVYVRVPSTTGQKKVPLCEKVGHGGGTLMFWGCISYNGLRNLVATSVTMHKNKYGFPSGDNLNALFTNRMMRHAIRQK